MSISLIIPAAGIGSRFGAALPKQYVELQGTPVIVRTIAVFANMPEINSILVAVSPEMLPIATAMIENAFPRRVIMTIGGDERQESIARCLTHEAVHAADVVLVHDAVRPFVSPNLVRQLIIAAEHYGAAIPGLEPSDTIKQITREGFVQETYTRSTLRAVQTPQAFRRELLQDSYQTAARDGFQGTDDASVVEYTGYPVKVIPGEVNNFKITTSADWERAEKFLESRVG